MKKCLLAFLWVICFIPVFSQIVYNGSLADTDPTFNRPDEGTPPTTLSASGMNVSYKVIALNITVAGLISVNSLSLWDNFLILYSPAGFNPLLPLENALVANDDLVGPNAGFTYNFTVPGNYTLVICSYKNGVTGPYTITASAPLPLPLRLLTFTASKGSGNTNIIRWSSAEERDLISYQVQLSVNNNNFNDLKDGSFEAKNNMAGNTYSFTDNKPTAGYNYYRLKITERSGDISYSPVVLVKNTRAGTGNLHVFPNPSSDYLRIEVKSVLNKKTFVSIINTAGIIIQSGQYYFNSQSVLSVEVKKLPAGKYFLKAIIDDEATIIPFIKN